MASVALPLPARTLVAALALIVFFAFAGPAAAAPQATSSTGSSACTIATKKLRAAKAKLAKVQRQAKRGRASRSALSKARRAVRKATAAKRKACAAPASPGGAPGGTPGGAPGETPDGAPGGTPGGTPPPPADQPGQQDPPPPPPPGDEPTTGALIQKALDEGRIDAETALRYRVFGEFGDDRLPEEFRGAPLGTDTDSLDEVAERWDELSPATREALDPFFIPPFNPGSWYDLSSARAESVEAQAGAVAEPGAQGSDLCENTAPNFNRWGYVTAAAGKVRVWYENTQAGQQEKAIAIAEYLDGGAWEKVTGLYRTPLPDGGDLTGQRCRGFDPAVDIALTPLLNSEGKLIAGGRTVAYYDKPDCMGPVPAFVLIARSLSGKTLMANVVHELAHVTHFAYALKHCDRQNVSWLTEATAAWTEDYVGGLGPDNPQQFAPYFFDRPNLPLERYEPETSTPRHYGSYLFFQWLAKNKGAEAVAKVWEDAESGADPVDSLQQTLTGLGFAGGFDEAWKRFALAGLNPLEKVDWFKQWGMPRGAAIDKNTVFSDDAGRTYDVNLPHLSSEYHWVDFSDAVKTVQVTNELAGVPGASVQLWLKFDDGGTEVRDITGEETTTFCRDLPQENVKELALVIADSTHADRTHVLKGKIGVKGRPGCADWDGTTKTTIKQDGLTEVYLANYTFKLQWTAPRDGGVTESYFMAQGSYDMQASWSISGVSESDGCTYSGSTSWPAGVVGLQATLDLRDAGPGNPATTYDFGFGLPFKSMLIQRSQCPDGYSGPVYWPVGIGFMSQPHPWDPTDQSIIGSETQDYGGVTIKREWSLSRNAIAP
ncbi:MAG TPA: hypothetical protein VJT68_06630 [Thermoleophilaceae bacterium]|nr:hypothetical protein [Thermoleophilaceae bacterium]